MAPTTGIKSVTGNGNAVTKRVDVATTGKTSSAVSTPTTTGTSSVKRTSSSILKTSSPKKLVSFSNSTVLQKVSSDVSKIDSKLKTNISSKTQNSQILTSTTKKIVSKTSENSAVAKKSVTVSSASKSIAKSSVTNSKVIEKTNTKSVTSSIVGKTTLTQSPIKKLSNSESVLKKKIITNQTSVSSIASDVPKNQILEIKDPILKKQIPETKIVGKPSLINSKPFASKNITKEILKNDATKNPVLPTSNKSLKKDSTPLKTSSVTKSIRSEISPKKDTPISSPKNATISIKKEISTKTHDVIKSLPGIKKDALKSPKTSLSKNDTSSKTTPTKMMSRQISKNSSPSVATPIIKKPISKISEPKSSAAVAPPRISSSKVLIDKKSISSLIKKNSSDEKKSVKILPISKKIGDNKPKSIKTKIEGMGKENKQKLNPEILENSKEILENSEKNLLSTDDFDENSNKENELSIVDDTEFSEVSELSPNLDLKHQIENSNTGAEAIEKTSEENLMKMENIKILDKDCVLENKENISEDKKFEENLELPQSEICENISVSESRFDEITIASEIDDSCSAYGETTENDENEYEIISDSVFVDENSSENIFSPENDENYTLDSLEDRDFILDDDEAEKISCSKNFESNENISGNFESNEDISENSQIREVLNSVSLKQCIEKENIDEEKISENSETENLIQKAQIVEKSTASTSKENDVENALNSSGKNCDKVAYFYEENEIQGSDNFLLPNSQYMENINKLLVVRNNLSETHFGGKVSDEENLIFHNFGSKNLSDLDLQEIVIHDCKQQKQKFAVCQNIENQFGEEFLKNNLGLKICPENKNSENFNQQSQYECEEDISFTDDEKSIIDTGCEDNTGESVSEENSEFPKICSSNSDEDFMIINFPDNESEYSILDIENSDIDKISIQSIESQKFDFVEEYNDQNFLTYAQVVMKHSNINLKILRQDGKQIPEKILEHHENILEASDSKLEIHKNLEINTNNNFESNQEVQIIEITELPSPKSDTDKSEDQEESGIIITDEDCEYKLISKKKHRKIKLESLPTKNITCEIKMSLKKEIFTSTENSSMYFESSTFRKRKLKKWGRKQLFKKEKLLEDVPEEEDKIYVVPVWKSIWLNDL